MTDYPIADFDRFRFFRDAEENVVSLEAQTFGEQLLPVLDCEFFRIARLHVHDRAALKADWLEAFDREMEVLSEIEEPVISRPFTWGRDDDELFYINDFLDGEALPDYLRREGARSPYLAASWLLPFVDLIDQREESPMSILRFSNMNLQVVRNLESNRAELHFTDFTAWTKPGNLVVERGPEYFLAQSFCSLISGIPIRDFTDKTLPSQFEDLPKGCQKAVKGTFNTEPGKGRKAFFAAIRKLANSEDASEEDLIAPQPRSLLRAWIREEYARIPELKSVPVLEEKIASEADLSYATEVEEMDLETLLQFYPGKSTIPREGWFEQHWISLRRQGRSFVNQLAVHEVQEHSSITVIHEENPNGVHLRRLIRETGPLDLDHAVAMARKLSSSLDGLESSTAAVPVWFLPEQNVFLNLGTRDSEEFKSAIESGGPDFWERIPFRLRLHQTMLGLLDGINFPKSLRSNAFELAKENPHIRRTAVLLPLIAMMLSGKRFDWEEEFVIKDSEVTLPEGLVAFINKIREQLLDKPLLLELGFLNKLSDFQEPPNPDDQWDHDAYEKEAEASRIEKKKATQESEGEVTAASELSDKEEAAPEEEEDVGGVSEQLQARARQENDEFKGYLSGKLGSDEIKLPVSENSRKPVSEKKVSKKKKVSEKPKADSSLPEKKKKVPQKAKSAKSKVPPKEDHKELVPKKTDPVAAQIPKAAQKNKGPKQNEAKESRKSGDSSSQPLNPIAAKTGPNLKKMASPVKEAAPKPEKKNTKSQPTVLLPEKPRGGLPWIWIVLAALVLGGGVGYYLDGKAKHAGLYAVDDEIEFPRTEYKLVSPLVNPFTNEIETLDPEATATPIAVLSDVTDLGAAIAKSKIEIEEQRYSSAVDLALWGLQMSPDSLEAAAQIESALTAWIESGVDAPAKTNDPTAVSVLSEYYLKNRPSEGLYILFGSANKGNPVAMRILGILFGQGKIVPKSQAIAERWLRKAAEKGDQDARFYFGESSVFGTLVKPNREGLSFIESAADAGHARSLFFRGYCCLEGKGIEQNQGNGYRYILRAAEKNSLEALYQKGLCNASGLGTEQNAFAAVDAFKNAAELGHVSSMFQYGQCLIVGFGTEPAYPDGASWMKKAAAAGHFDAKNWCSQHQVEFEPLAEQ